MKNAVIYFSKRVTTLEKILGVENEEEAGLEVLFLSPEGCNQAKPPHLP